MHDLTSQKTDLLEEGTAKGPRRIIQHPRRTYLFIPGLASTLDCFLISHKSYIFSLTIGSDIVVDLH